MQIKTKISKLTENDMILRGEKHSKLIEESTFSDTIFLTLSGRKPTQTESKLFNSLLVSVIDHGAGTASSISARCVASTGNPINAAAASGILALGDYHGGAIGNAMLQFNSLKDVNKFVEDSLNNKKIIFGYGHKVYKEEDPRVAVILQICNKLNYKSRYIQLALDIEKAIEKLKGKKIPLNIDGLAAAILLEMGFSPEAGNGFFIIGRVPGLVAHAIEQKSEPVMRLDEKDIIYIGK